MRKVRQGDGDGEFAWRDVATLFPPFPPLFDSFRFPFSLSLTYTHLHTPPRTIQYAFSPILYSFPPLLLFQIPRPPVPGAGRVFLYYTEAASAQAAIAALGTKKFGDLAIVARLYPDQPYFNAKYDVPAP